MRAHIIMRVRRRTDHAGRKSPAPSAQGFFLPVLSGNYISSFSLLQEYILRSSAPTSSS